MSWRASTPPSWRRAKEVEHGDRKLYEKPAGERLAESGRGTSFDRQRKNVKILFALHQFFPEHFAGVENLTLGLARELKARGHKPHVFAAKRSAPVHDMEAGEIEDYEYAGIPVRRVGRPTEGLGRPFVLNYRSEMMAERAREYMREIGPDVVHAMHFQGLTASVIQVFKEFGTPIVYTATDFWTVCPVVDLRRHDGVMCEGPEINHCIRCVVYRYPGSRRKRTLELTPDVVLKSAGWLSRTRFADRFGPLRQVRALKERPESIREQLKLVDHIIAPTRLTRNLLVANGVGDGKVEVSHYGIDVSDILGAPENRNVPPPLRVGYIGTLAPHKGCDILIRAFKDLPPALEPELTIYGDRKRFRPFVRKLWRLAGEDDPKSFKSSVKRLLRIVGRDERITFAGTFPSEEIGHVLAEMDVLVIPSRWYENTPLVVYSAFAAGTPVIATDLGGLSEVVEPEVNGLLFELENADDLARQLRKVGEEPGLLEKLRAGIGPVKTVEENVDELENLYASLLEKSKGG